MVRLDLEQFAEEDRMGRLRHLGQVGLQLGRLAAGGGGLPGCLEARTHLLHAQRQR